MIRALAITVSNRAAAGVYEDRSGPVLAGLLKEAGCSVDGPLVVPDGEPVEAALREAVASGYDVVVTTGGTGLTPGDLTPEMTRRVLDREIPGIAEAIRAAGDRVPQGCLDRLAVGHHERPVHGAARFFQEPGQDRPGTILVDASGGPVGHGDGQRPDHGAPPPAIMMYHRRYFHDQGHLS